MKFTVIVGQLFSLNPVLGVWDTDTTKLRFTYFSGRCVYTFLTISCQVIFLNLLFLVRYLKTSDTDVKMTTALVFYASNTIITVLFLRIATKWPKLCQYIARTEAADPLYDTTLVRKCNLSCILILLLAALEHGLSEIAGFVLAADCEPEKIYHTFIAHSFPWIEDIITYSQAIAILTQFLNIQCTFNWNFADVFVICISYYLTARLEQVNKKIAASRGKCVPLSFWRTVREDYNRATSLVRRVDEVIGSVIFISFANNLFFICLQLLHMLADGIKITPACSEGPEKRLFRGYEHAVYYAYSLIFLIFRSTTVSLIASRVHTASREPAYTLYEVPSAVYCIEVQRFIEQIHGETVALTGLQFFKVKRGIVLAIAGTIVTYELVLMQFTGVTPTAAPLHSDTDTQ
ncbi:gustatory receptor for sugar taste 64e-like [Maniola hyperantus]|uniref:gustatory receptor for sugar taste 64e-like n=1 Tax=Aphantopus hyperantus TaxID=2795564 RepID=UPI00374827F1